MRSASSALIGAKTSARDTGIVPRWFFWARVKDRETGAPVELGYWTGDWTIDIAVIAGETGFPVTRQYVGGVNLNIGDIPRVSDLTIQSVSVSMSAIATITQQLVRGYDCRLARCEIHSVDLDTVTRLPVDAPIIEFIGQIDDAPIETGAAGGESTIQLKVRDDAMVMLTRPNPRKRSAEGQKRRLGDEFGRYSNSVKSVQISWGE
jgi:hypothetical protein